MSKDNRTLNTFLNTLIGFLYLAIHTIYAFILTGITISCFGSADNGMVSSIRQLLTYASLVDCGIGAACIMSYYSPLANNNYSEVRNIYNKSKKFFFIIGFIFLLLIIILAYCYPLIIKSHYSYNYIVSVFLTIGISQAFSYAILEKYKSLLIADQRYRFVQLGMLITDILSIIFIIFAVKYNLIDSLLELQIIITFITFLQFIYYRYIFNKYYYWIDSIPCTSNINSNPIKQIKATFVHTISQTIAYNTDIILLTIFRSLPEISIYSVYSMVFAMADSVFSVLTRGIEGSLGNLYNSDKAEFAKLFRRYEFSYILIASIIVSIILFTMEPFLLLFTKNESQFMYWDFSIFLCFILISFFNNIRNPHGMLIRISENYNRTKHIFIIEAFLNFALSISLVRNYGIVGVLSGTILSVAIRDFFVIRFVYKNVLESSFYSFLRILISNFFFVLALFYISNIIIDFKIINYLEFSIYLILVSFVIAISNLSFNFIFNYTEMHGLYVYIKKILQKIIV